MNNGYVAIHRKMLDNPIVCKDTDHMAVWTYLLLNATHTNYDVMFKNERLTLAPGQLLTGRKSIAEKLKVNESKVQRILKLFESEQQIEQVTSSQNRLITILQWNLYQRNGQQNEQQMNNKRTTDEQQVNTNNKVNKVKNEKKEQYDIFAKEVLRLYPGKKVKAVRDKKLPKLLKEYGEDQIIRCMERHRKEMKKSKTEMKFIMHESTFWNGGYIDYLDENVEEKEVKKRPPLKMVYREL